MLTVTPALALSPPIPISGHTRVFMVLGDPVTQVQAPAIFNRVFQRHGVDAVLVPLQVRAEHLAAFARTVLAEGQVAGLWLTIPHKTTLMPLLAAVDEAGRVAQSVNAVRLHTSGGLEGGLFDGLGLVRALHHHGIDPHGLRVLLVGTGGAGAAIATALLAAGVAALALHDLGERAQHLAARLADPRVSTPGADPAGFDLVINATPLGLRAHDPLPVDVERLSPQTRVVDILMKPQTSPLRQACAARGIASWDGFEMLVQQVPDYLRFFDLAAVADAVQHDLQDVRDHLRRE